MSEVTISEWLETDGLGGYASGSVGLIPERKYHGLLVSSKKHPLERQVLITGAEIFIKQQQGLVPLTSVRYQDGTLNPNPNKAGVSTHYIGHKYPKWQFDLPDGMKVTMALLMKRGQNKTLLRFAMESPKGVGASILFRPLLSVRDIHSLRRDCDLTPQISTLNSGVVIRLEDSTTIAMVGQGFKEERLWFHKVFYAQEEMRGYDSTESLFSPGHFDLNFKNGLAFIGLSSDFSIFNTEISEEFSAELARRDPLSRIDISSEQFIVERELSSPSSKVEGTSIIAGYPWFSDWGRDTLVAARGLVVAQGRSDVALSILRTWGGTLRRGIIANTFAEGGGETLYNSADASLWYIILTYETQKLLSKRGEAMTPFEPIKEYVREIINRYQQGTDFGIGVDDDGLLFAGDGKHQLTWMDAKIGDLMVTPRSGKPVELQALWINCLRASGEMLKDSDALKLAQRAEDSFNQKFWNKKINALYDVVDVDRLMGQNDDTLRLNQVFACGGLIWPVLAVDKAKIVLNFIEEQLLTPLGLRTLTPLSSSYLGRYKGDQRERDLAYHQGSVWPWPMAAFVDAWLRVRGYSVEAKQEARELFVLPLENCLSKTGHLFELADGDAPHSPQGCPFQAWSLGEFVRILKMIEIE